MGGGWGFGEDEAGVVRAFGEGDQVVAGAGFQFDIDDVFDLAGIFDALDGVEAAFCGDGHHHDAGGLGFAVEGVEGFAGGVAEDDFFEGHAAAEAEGAGALAADGAGGDVEGPDAAVVDAEFGVDGAVGEGEGGGGGLDGGDDVPLAVFGEAGGSDVDGFLEVWAVERVGLVEDGEGEELPAAEEGFDGDFFAGDEGFDEEAVGGAAAFFADMGEGEDALEAAGGAEEGCGVVGADDAAGAVEGEGLDDEGVVEAVCDGSEVLVEAEEAPLGRGDAALREALAEDGFVAGAEDGVGGVGAELEFFGGAGGEEGAGIIDGDDGVEREAVGVAGDGGRAAFGVVVGEAEPAAGVHVGEGLVDVGGDDDVEAEFAGGGHEVGSAVGGGGDEEHYSGHVVLQGDRGCECMCRPLARGVIP